MGVMYARDITPYNSSFFLFGPRGTGKSTWLKKKFPDAYFIDLLKTETFIEYQKNPGILRAEIESLNKEVWIIIDEIQRVPELLNEVHSLMENSGYKKFILTGSSARKLKRTSANMLAGRALLKKMFCLNANETKYTIDSKQRTFYGMLPMSVSAESDEQKEAYLESYVVTYLNEEIKAEGLTRNLGSFSRFLEVAALSAASKINISGLARDAGIGRDTVRGYFSIFEDTLLGSWLPAYRPRAKVKEVAKPKFYWFDSGVLNASAGAFKQPMPRDWEGVLFEHTVYHEIVSYMEYSKLKGSLGFWQTSSGTEIDFLWWYGDKIIAIEVKSSDKFRNDYLKGIKSFSETNKLAKSYIIYNGKKELIVEGTKVLPFQVFCKKLHEGEILR